MSDIEHEAPDPTWERIEHYEAPAFSHGVELHVAASSGNADSVAALVRYGADTDSRTPVGRRTLHTTVHGGQSAAVKALLDAGADPNAPVSHTMSWTPLHMAAIQGDSTTIEALSAADAGTAAKDDLGRSAFGLLPDNVPRRVREACNPARGRSRGEEREGRTETADVTLRRDDWVRQPGGSWEAPKT